METEQDFTSVVGTVRKKVSLPVLFEIGDGKSETASDSMNNEFCGRRISISITMITWVALAVLVVALSIGLPSIFAAYGITENMSELYRNQTIQLVRGRFDGMGNILSNIALALAPYNVSGMMKADDLSWCASGTGWSDAVGHIFSMITAPTVDHIIAAHFNLDGTSSVLLVDDSQRIDKTLIICRNKAMNPMANIYQVVDLLQENTTILPVATIPFGLSPPDNVVGSGYVWDGYTGYFLSRGFWPVQSSMYEPAYLRGFNQFTYYPSNVVENLITIGFRTDDILDVFDPLLEGDTTGLRVLVLETDGSVIGCTDRDVVIMDISVPVLYKLHELDDVVLAAIGNALDTENGGLETFGTDSLSVSAGGDSWIVDVVQWTLNDHSVPMVAMSVRSRTSIFGPSEILRSIVIIFTCVFSAVAIGITMFVTWRLLLPLRMVSKSLSEISRLEFRDNQVPTSQSVFKEVAHLQDAATSVRSGLNAFIKYVPPQVCNHLLSGALQPRLEMTAAQVSIMFLDVVGFTEMSEKENPERLAIALAKCFNAMVKSISESGGTIDKFIGDSIMAFWNAPVKVQDYDTATARTALDCLYVSKTLSEDQDKEDGSISLRVKFGLSTGSCLVGNIGAFDRFNYTVVGRYINEAARLEPATRYFDVDIIISQSMYTNLPENAFICRRLRLCIFKGFSEPRQIYELICEGKRSTGLILQMVKSYESALEIFETGDLRMARIALATHMSEHPADGPAKVLVAEIDYLIEAGLPADWTPVKIMNK